MSVQFQSYYGSHIQLGPLAPISPATVLARFFLYNPTTDPSHRVSMLNVMTAEFIDEKPEERRNPRYCNSDDRDCVISGDVVIGHSSVRQ